MQINSSDILKISNPGKNGWPWTDSSLSLAPTLPDGQPWPKISIVTPSFNQAHFLEETIRSVLLQGYPNLEYFIIDGGSTDESVGIIKKYEPWLTFWISEKDAGQSQAINKGFQHATGVIGGWLSSDDIYLPGTLSKVALVWHDCEDQSFMITGNKLIADASLEHVARIEQSPYTLQHLLERCILDQPATFFPLNLFQQVGGVNEKYYMALDYDLWLRMCKQGAGLIFSGYNLAITRSHSQAKTIKYRRRSILEALRTNWDNYRVIPDPWLDQIIASVIIPQWINSYQIRRFFKKIGHIIYLAIRKITQLLKLSQIDQKNNPMMTIIVTDVNDDEFLQQYCKDFSTKVIR